MQLLGFPNIDGRYRGELGNTKLTIGRMQKDLVNSDFLKLSLEN